MRLIDADELIKAIEQSRNNNPHKDCRIKRIHDIEHDHFIKMVSEQQTAFDKEKVIEELKSNMGSAQLAQSLAGTDLVQCGGFSYGYYNGVKDAVKIVEKGGLN